LARSDDGAFCPRGATRGFGRTPRSGESLVGEPVKPGLPLTDAFAEGVCLVKKLLILSASLLLTAVAVSWWGSLQTRKVYRSWVADLDQHGDVRVLESDYTAGWLSSDAILSVELRGAAGDAFRGMLEHLGREDVRARVGVRMRHRLEHGALPLWSWLQAGFSGPPDLLRVTSTIELDGESQTELHQTIGRLSELSATTVVDATGEGETMLSMPAQDLEPRPPSDEPVRASGRLEGLIGRVVFSLRDSSLVARLRVPGMMASSRSLHVALRGVDLALDWRRDPRGIWIGHTRPRLAALRIDRLHETPAAEPAADLAGPSPEDGDAPGSPEPNPAASHPPASLLGASMAAIPELPSRAGPTVPIEPAVPLRERLLELHRLSMAFETSADQDGIRVGAELSAAEIEAGTHSLRDGTARVVLRGLALDPASGADPDAAASPSGLLARLAVGSPTFELASLECASPDGPIEASAHLRLREAAVDRTDELPLAQALEGAGEFEMPEALFDALSSSEAAWPIRTAGRVHAHMELRDGVFLVNGEPLALPSILATFRESRSAGVPARTPEVADAR
jgi:hypothetical protein